MPNNLYRDALASRPNLVPTYSWGVSDPGKTLNPKQISDLTSQAALLSGSYDKIYGQLANLPKPGINLTIPGGQVLTGQAAADYFAAHPAGTSPVLPQITTPAPAPAAGGQPSQSSNLPVIPPGVSMTGGNVNQTTSSNRTMDLWDLIQSMQMPTPVQPGLSPPATGWGF